MLGNSGGIRVRVGDPLSPVEPGDAVPGGGVYRAGQYAPTIDELASMTLSEADNAGILPSNIPVYTPEGTLDQAKLEGWKPLESLQSSGISMSGQVPKYSAAIIVSSIYNMGNVPRALGLSYILAGDREDVAKQRGFGESIIAARVDASGRTFTGSLVVYPNFYKYISTPIVPKIPGRTEGLSVATYAVHHAVGHLLFARLGFDGSMGLIGNFLDCGGWARYADVGAYYGTFMGVKNTSVWRRSELKRFETELSKYSPMDDFSDTFALYFTNKNYLSQIFPDRLEVMAKILDKYGV